MRPRKLPFKQFLKTFEFVPRVAVNLLVERSVEVSQTSREVLLTRRKKPPFAGSWHLPGSFLLKNEPLMDCVHRVAKEELGIETMVKWLNGPMAKNDQLRKRLAFELAGVFDDLTGDPRGHVVDVVYRVHMEEMTQWLNGQMVKKSRQFSRSMLKPVGDTAEIRFFKRLPKNIGFNHRETLKSLGYT